jgi:hypothetical protein
MYTGPFAFSRRSQLPSASRLVATSIERIDRQRAREEK